MTMNSVRTKRAFTLVELMIVVAIIGVLAALAVYGVGRYLGSSKTSEAKQTIGAISRAAQAAFERENAMSEDLAEGTFAATASHMLCGPAQPVPAGAVPPGRKYQPKTSNGDDYDSGSENTGWKCLRFGMTQPHYYQYNYSKDKAVQSSTNPAACNANCYEAAAFGDIDADMVLSQFSQTGKIANGELKKATQLYVDNEYE